MRLTHEEADRYQVARERADFNVAAVIAGEVVSLVRDIPTAAEIVQRIMSEFNELRAGLQHERDLQPCFVNRAALSRGQAVGN